MIGHSALPAFAPIVIAAVTGTVISRMHYGDYPAFIVPQDWVLASFWEFPAFALLGLVSAFAAIAFMRSVSIAHALVERLPLPVWSLPAFGGLLVGGLAIRFPEVLGVGYEATDAALSELYPLWMLLALIVVKTAATAISLACRFGGGVFSPSLFLGAMVGGAFGLIATEAFPDYSSGHGAYTLIGMGAVAGAVLGAPISTILMIFELTTDYRLTIAVMIATAIASVVTKQVFGRSFFTWQLEQRGINIKGGQDVGLLRSMKVGNLMDPRYHSIPPEMPIADVRRRLQAAPWGELFVVQPDSRRLVGTITLADLSGAAFDTSHDEVLTASHLVRDRPIVLYVGDDLEAAVGVYGASGESHLPVVDSDERMTLLGVAHEHEVVLAYQRALSQTTAEHQGEL